MRLVPSLCALLALSAPLFGQTASPKPAPGPEVLLKAEESTYTSWYNGKWGGGGPPPTLLLRVFSDRSAENGKNKATLTPEQFKRVQSFLDNPDLLALKPNASCGMGGTDYQTNEVITLYHHHREQSFQLANFYPGTQWGRWPGNCPTIIVKLQCTVWRLMAETDAKPDPAKGKKEKEKENEKEDPKMGPDCRDILPN